VPSAGHFVNTGQPIQGCFAHVVSGHIEDDPGRIGRLDRGGRCPQSEEKQSDRDR
jgi:hypothetical protein